LVILLFGPPGCGKGTQSPLISKLLGIPAISTGDMLRAEVAAGTELGKMVADIMASGGLVNDDLVSQALVSRVEQPDCRNGFLLDGFPRTVRQAEFLTELLQRKGLGDPTVLHFNAKHSVLVERLTARRQCPTCGRIYNILFKPPVKPGVCDVDGTPLVRRADDKAEVVKQRLVAYNQQTKPVIDYYKNGDFHHINADRPPAEITREVERIVGARVNELSPVELALQRA
jgi:adenylate kinase